MHGQSKNGTPQNFDIGKKYVNANFINQKWYHKTWNFLENEKL